MAALAHGEPHGVELDEVVAERLEGGAHTGESTARTFASAGVTSTKPRGG